MIAVIADDFTGAAEIGGIGLRHGLEVVIETEPINKATADLLIVATDTRSMKAEDASKHIAKITRELISFNPRFIYKKLDSVLRGNVVDELLAQMEVSGKNRSIIVAANPVFRRIIKNGMYYIDNVPLNKTCFSSDPQYPIKTSLVTEILSTNRNYTVVNAKPEDDLPEKGLVAGDVVSLDDLKEWTGKMDNDTLLAGASGFFNALLDTHLDIKKERTNLHSESREFGERALFVLGSAFPKDAGFLKKIACLECQLINMPEEIYFDRSFDPRYFDRWADDIVSAIQNNKKVFVSMAHSGSTESGVSDRLSKVIGELMKNVTDRVKIDELLIEGGSTTSTILSHLGIKTLYPVRELEMGVIRMKVEGDFGFYLTTKPGSYTWPEEIWNATINQH